MPETNLTYSGWRKSSRSGNNGGNCVEVGFADEARAIRDTKQAHDPNRATLEVSGTAFSAFLARVKSGEIA